MKHKKKIIAGIIIAIIIIILIIMACIINSAGKKPFNTTKNISFAITNGESFDGVIADLSSKGYVNNSTLLKLDAKMTGETPTVTPGDYTIKGGVNLNQFTAILKNQKGINVVIPEGYDVEQIANKLNNFGVCNKEDFINAVKNYKLPEFIKSVDGRRYQLEGYLFPTTYNFKKGENPNTIIETMVNNFVLSLDESIKATGVKITPAQINEVVTKASIIQQEAKTPEEMAKVSSVIDNRLKKKMPLQMDDTVIYALGKHVDKVYYKDLEVKSPYNTYINKGLPIGPICSPGKEAIEAALKPANTDYVYYILTSTQNYFTNSYSDFLKKKEAIYGKVTVTTPGAKNSTSSNKEGSKTE